ncbi:MAG: GTPase [Planctomycetaceae bacterium]|nr:cyclic 2,3-diphosphoglycerate synthase [Planctomycetota bacterium]NUN52012.1 GTPase [Planctomycetaceae bacterium]
MSRASAHRIRTILVGAAGRDFHDFNVVFRDDPRHEVVAFTAAQIPNIDGRRYPAELAGKHYPEGIPIRREEDLERLVRDEKVDLAVFSYSDISHENLMHLASRVVAAGADFSFLSADRTMVRSTKPVVSVCAVRTGCGKSPTSRKVAAVLRQAGLRAGIVRHPMPYGDLAKQAVQRFASVDDLSRHECTIEEMEEYEGHILEGHVVFAGVDYERILRRVEKECDVVLWDGGNNDTPFYRPDLEIVLVDPHRPGHERAYFPGEVNFLRAQVIVIPKIDSADPAAVDRLRRSIHDHNPSARVVDAAMPLVVDRPEMVKGKRVLVVEDGPTLTHGEMRFGAGVLAARRLGASEIVDPRPFAVGSIRETFAKYPHVRDLLPAMGYGERQVHELEETIRRVDCDAVVVATPIDLGRILKVGHPTCRVRYELEETGALRLADVLADVVRRARG